MKALPRGGGGHTLTGENQMPRTTFVLRNYLQDVRADVRYGARIPATSTIPARRLESDEWRAHPVVREGYTVPHWQPYGDPL
jgi:hypothetical protein